jgi:hypothetical protein
MRLFGTIEPLPPSGPIVSTSCSTAQSPLMFNWPSGRRAARVEVSTGVVFCVNCALRFTISESLIEKFSM